MQDLLNADISHDLGSQCMVIDDAFCPSASRRTLPVINPGNGSSIGAIPRGDAEDIDAAVRAAVGALKSGWGKTCASARGKLLLCLAAEIAAHRVQIAQIESTDTGKPLKQAVADVDAPIQYFEFYGAAADKVHGETIPYQNGFTVFTKREPHGVTGHIIPWNYPVQMFGRSVAPALTMGNACVMKPAEDASLSSIVLGQLALRAGFPPGALNIVTGYGAEAGAALAAHPGVAYISFTGSPRVGTAVQQAAALNHRPVTLELGGKSPQIVFADADQDAALPAVLAAIIQNAGQTCSAGSRLLVQSEIYDVFVSRLAEQFAALRVGPAWRTPDVGPVISAVQRDRVQSYLDAAKREDIAVLAQGQIMPDAPLGGFYVKPTLLGEVAPYQRLFREEVFGPVLTVTRFRDEQEAITLANGTPYGLVAGVWTADGGRQFRMADALECGQVYINNYGAGGGVALPFGGVKRSGHGREKGMEALLHFSVTKTIAIRHS